MSCGVIRELCGVPEGKDKMSLTLVGLRAACQARYLQYAVFCFCLQPSGYCIYRQFNIRQFYVLPTQSIYVFCVDLRTNSQYFPIQH